MSSSSARSNSDTFGGLVFRIWSLRGWVKRARERLRIFQGNDIDQANSHGEAIKEAECKEVKSGIFYTTFDDTSFFYYIWTGLVCLVTLHPLIFIAMSVFDNIYPFLTSTSHFNHFLNIIYLLDLFIQTRLEIVDNGVPVKNLKILFQHRIRSACFLVDIICILPLDLIPFISSSFFFGRFNRLFKCYRLSDFASLSEIRTTSPHAFRLFKLMFICFVIFHWNGCLYFYISKVYNFVDARLDDWIFSYDKIINPILAECNPNIREDPEYCNIDEMLITHLPDNKVQTVVTSFMRTEWTNKTRTVSFTDLTRQYALSFYWSALTLVTLGEQPSPINTFQNAFEIVDTLLGLVIFAVIVGDVGNMVVAINLRRSDFENVLDGCKQFAIYRKVPLALRKKAVEYFTYSWAHGGGQVDEEEVADFLPPRLFGEIAVEIHMDTLKRVKLFEDCDPRLLYELILKLQPRMYSPMDYVCKKGEVGTEMYIVKKGFVEVVSEDGQQIFVTLGNGVVFGELSILNIPGNKNKNLRTASVRSKGYSDLYVLDKEDLWEALREYPQAKDSLIDKGKQILSKDNLLDENMENDEEDEICGPIEERLSRYQEETQILEKMIDEAEIKIRDSHRCLKNRLFRVETGLINIMNAQNK